VEQGFHGAVQATVTGLAFGATFVLTRRTWMPMIAHATYDLTALALIYWGVESEVWRMIL